MRINEKTKEVLSFIEKYGFITAKICSRTIYKGYKQNYQLASRKLRKMEQGRLLQRYLDNSNEYIYQINKKHITPHKYYLIDFYSKLYEKVDSVELFEVERLWKVSKKRNDGFIIYKNGDSFYSLLIEIDYSHFTSKEKLESLYESKEIQKYFKNNYDIEDYFPTVVIVSMLGNSKYKDVEFDYVSLDFNFTNIDILLGA